MNGMCEAADVHRETGRRPTPSCIISPWAPAWLRPLAAVNNAATKTRIPAFNTQCERRGDPGQRWSFLVLSAPPLLGVRQCLAVVLICISLTEVNMVFPLWKNVYLSPVPTFKKRAIFAGPTLSLPTSRKQS